MKISNHVLYPIASPFCSVVFVYFLSVFSGVNYSPSFSFNFAMLIFIVTSIASAICKAEPDANWGSTYIPFKGKSQ